MKKILTIAAPFFIGAFLGGMCGVILYDSMANPKTMYRAIQTGTNNYLVANGGYGYVPGDTVAINGNMTISNLTNETTQAVIIEIINQ